MCKRTVDVWTERADEIYTTASPLSVAFVRKEDCVEVLGGGNTIGGRLNKASMKWDGVRERRGWTRGGGGGRKGESGDRGCTLGKTLDIGRHGIQLRRRWKQTWREGGGCADTLVGEAMDIWHGASGVSPACRLSGGERAAAEGLTEYFTAGYEAVRDGGGGGGVDRRAASGEQYEVHQ